MNQDKVLAAKAALRGALDLSFDPGEPRGTDGRWIRAAMRASSQKERNAIRTAAMNDYQKGYTSNQEHNKVNDILDQADNNWRTQRPGTPDYKPGKWSSIQEPSKEDAAVLAAKNDLAKARLSGSDRKVAKAEKKLAAASFKATQAKNQAAAVSRASTYYGSADHKRAVAKYENWLGAHK